MQSTGNIRIKDLRLLTSPKQLLNELPITEQAATLVTKTRNEIQAILNGESKKLLIIVGPCSIHDPQAAIEYAQKLKACADAYQNELCIVMRTYFEKPRTTVGWKGLINDPNLNHTFHINEGLRSARKLLLTINELGIPTGSEFLDTIIPQYISDLTSWAAIGARTTESQIHRELASGLSMPVGFKNGTTGNLDIAVDAIFAAQQPHHFLGVSPQGVAAIVSTTGNEHGHIILRGSKDHTNYDPASIQQTEVLLKQKHLSARIMVDCSHGNSGKDYTKQKRVLDSICQQLSIGNQSIFGLMIESHLTEGNQALTLDKPLRYGQSITDACVGWDETEILLSQLSKTVITHPD